jgi:predicted ATPase
MNLSSNRGILTSTRFQVGRELGRGGMGTVYEAFDRDTNAVVALKVLRGVNGDLLYRFKREFRSLADVQHPNLLRFGELLCADDEWFFTMELVRGQDFLAWVRTTAADGEHDAPTVTTTPGETHATRRAQPSRIRAHAYDEARLRSAARQLAEAIAALHRSGRVHRDVKPSNVLVRNDGHVVLLDFGLVSDIGGPREAADQPIVGTPLFMAPEQVINEHVGPAADWYAFGALLFLSLTGTLPFSGAPPTVLEAKRERPAPAPGDLRPDVPADLNELCVALLARDPAARPQDDEILRRLGSAEGERSAMAAWDAPTLFIGRTAELAELAEAFTHVQAGQSEFVVVQGEPGVGKSALVRWFLERREPPKGIVLEGRCYEQESVPFKAFDTVIDSLSLHLARLSDAASAKLLSGGVGCLAEVFPVLRRVPAVATRLHTEREMLGNVKLREHAFVELKRLLHAMATEVPLVLFIDDLQWADQDSFALLEALFTGADAPCALLLATMRSVSPHGATVAALSRLPALPFRHIDLHGLSREESRSLWNALWAVSQGDASGVPRDPGQILDEATGHPLFLAELVRDAQRGRDFERPHARLQDVLWERVTALDDKSQRFMELVALAGAPIRYDVVAAAAQLDVTDSLHLVGALRTTQMVRVSRRGDERLVEPYHDRIREGIVEHLHDEDRPPLMRAEPLHLRLGRRLLESTTERDLPSAVFSIVKHLNAASELIESGAELERLAELNLLAGREAFRATAYRTAVSYLQRGIALLGPTAWSTSYELCRSLHTSLLEAEYLDGQREQALARFADIHDHLATSEERADLYVTRIVREIENRMLREAIAAAREGLAPLGVKLPRRTGPASVLREYVAARLSQRGRSAEQLAEHLAELPEVRDSRIRSALKILDAMMPATFFVSGNLLAMCLLRTARITMRHGVSMHSPFSLAGYGVALSGVVGDFEGARRLGQAALRLQERFPNAQFTARIYWVNGLWLTPFVRPYAEAEAELRRVCGAALEVDDVGIEAYPPVEAYAAGALTAVTACSSMPLAELQALAEATSRVAAQRRDHDMFALSSSHARYCATLRGLSHGFIGLGSDDADERAFGETFSRKRTPTGFFFYHFLRTKLAYLFGDLNRARELLCDSERYISVIPTPPMVELRLLRLVVDVHGYAEAPLSERLARRRRIKRCLKQLSRWARACPENHAAPHRIACAEYARLFRPRLAGQRYEEAIATARGQSSARWQAFAHELAARHCRERGDAAAATAHCEAAVEAYGQWGAAEKARHLAATFSA